MTKQSADYQQDCFVPRNECHCNEQSNPCTARSNPNI